MENLKTLWRKPISSSSLLCVQMTPEFIIITFFYYVYEKMSIIITSPFLLFERLRRQHGTFLVYDNTQNWKMTFWRYFLTQYSFTLKRWNKKRKLQLDAKPIEAVVSIGCFLSLWTIGILNYLQRLATKENL